VIDRAKDWLVGRPWTRWALVGAAAVVVIAAIASAGAAWYRSRDAQGAAALGLAITQAQRAEAAPGSAETRDRAIGALEGVIAEHSGSTAVAQAAYALGNLRYAGGQYAQARGAYELALAKGASGVVKAMAGNGIGYTWEAEKDYANAVQAYERSLKALGPKDFLYEDTLLSLARVQALAGKPAVALELYERALKDVPDSRRGDEIRARIAELKSRSATK
jgi:tetratricopeptide (TPR) repeat protein